MSIVVNRGELAAALAWISRALPSRPAQPVLAGAKITVEGDLLTVQAFDYEQSAVATIACEANGTSLAAIAPGRLTADLAKALQGDRVTLTPLERRLQMVGGRSKFVLPLLPFDDYPSLPLTPPRIGTVLSDDFVSAVKRVAVAAGKDDTLPTLTGVLLVSDPDAGTLTFAATDRYRLSVATIPYSPEAGASPLRALIPARILDGYAKTVEHGSTVSILGGEGALFGITTGSRSAATRLLDGDFPKYESLLPTEFSGTATVAVSELADAIRRVALVAERNVPVRCTFADGQVEIAVASDDTSASEVVDIDYDGEEFSTAFNPGYFTDGLATVSTETVAIQLTQPNRPCLVVSTDESDDSKYLLMPVRLSS